MFRNKQEIVSILKVDSRIRYVYECLKNNLSLTAHGYYWIRLDVSKEVFPKTIAVKGRKGRHRAIQQFDLDGNLLNEWSSAVLAAKTLGFSSFNITRCMNKNNQYKGFKWFYSPVS